MKVLRVKRIFIKPSECTNHTLCEPELVKGAITMDGKDSSGYEVAVLHQDKLPRTKESLLSMLSAADVCPMDAFYIELEDGSEMNVWADYVQKKIEQGKIEWS